MNIQKKLAVAFLSVNAIIIISGVVMGVLVSDSLEESKTRNAQASLAEFVNLQANAHLQEGIFGETDYNKTGNVFAEFFSQINLDSVLRIKVWNSNATIIYSNNPAIIGQSFADNDEFRKAIRGEVSAEIKPPEKRENAAELGYGQIMEVYVPVVFTGSDRPGGVIEVYLKMDDLNAEIAQINRKIWSVVAVSAIAGILLSIFLGVFFSGRISGPIISLKAAAEEIDRGNLDAKISVRTGDEVEALANAFRQMASDIKASKDAIEKDKAEMKKKNWELERFNKIAVGRELKMIELKKKIAGLEGGQRRQRK